MEVFNRKMAIIDYVAYELQEACQTIVDRYACIINDGELYHQIEEVADLLSFMINDSFNQIEDVKLTDKNEILSMFENDIREMLIKVITDNNKWCE